MFEDQPIPTFDAEPRNLDTSLSKDSTCSPYRFNSRGYGSHQAITELIRPGTSVLDIGCASGYLMTHLQNSKGCRCVGIEQSREAALVARNAGFRVLNDDALDGIANIAKTDRFDHIVFGDVLEHLVDPMAVLVASRSLLSPSGSVIVSLPNIVSLRARVTIALGIWRYHESGVFDKTHLRFFSVKTGRELLREAGFRITHEEFVGPLTFWGGRHLKFVNGLWPNLLGNQMVFSAQTNESSN